MNLVLDDIRFWGNYIARLQSTLPPPDKVKEPHEYGMYVDFGVTTEIANHAQTIVFDSDLLMELIGQMDRVDLIGRPHFPFPFTCIQLTRPLPEEDVMAYPEVNDWQLHQKMEKDYVTAILLSDVSREGEILHPRTKYNCVVWFMSKSVNRVAFTPGGPKDTASITFEKPYPDHLNERQLANKRRLVKIAYCLSMFFSAENVKLDMVRADPKVQAKRQRKGKKKLPEYWKVLIKKVQPVYADVNKGTGRQHTHMYPVRGHFRHYKNGTRVWIKNHYRGLAFGPESLRKEIYEVRKRSVAIRSE